MEEKKTTIRMAGVVRESIVDGPGIRWVFFAQGCPHQCTGCHNPDSWAVDGGQDASLVKLLEDIQKNPLLDGITLSGGEPFLQAESLALLAKEAHRMRLSVMTYTGFTWEELFCRAEKDKGVKNLLLESDILVDGAFIESEKSIELKFRGSKNQRIIDVKKSLLENRPVISDIQER